jgi:three-Cys-motif partner protein
MTAALFEEIGYWSELKLEIIEKYGAAYSRILAAQGYLRHIYVDAFAGLGVHRSRQSGTTILGSPLRALGIEPPFREYHFIERDDYRAETLRDLVQTVSPTRENVTVHAGDCNAILVDRILPTLTWQSYRRALVLLDPYGLDLRWQVMRTAGELRTVDMLLNFPVMDMNRNVLWRRELSRVAAEDVQRMNAFWGDDSWRRELYTTTRDLFGHEQKVENEEVAEAFARRLQTVAGFGYVAKPLPMRNSNRAVVYYLMFASQKSVASKIIDEIFDTYRNRGR